MTAGLPARLNVSSYIAGFFFFLDRGVSRRTFLTSDFYRCTSKTDVSLQLHHELGHFGLTHGIRGRKGEQEMVPLQLSRKCPGVGVGGPEKLDSERERPRPAEEVCRGESRQVPLIYHRH